MTVATTIANKALDEYIETLEQLEKQHILKAIKVCDGNLTKAARLLGIGRATIYRKLKGYLGSAIA